MAGGSDAHDSLPPVRQPFLRGLLMRRALITGGFIGSAPVDCLLAEVVGIDTFRTGRFTGLMTARSVLRTPELELTGVAVESERYAV
jgi:hypothetical protein